MKICLVLLGGTHLAVGTVLALVQPADQLAISQLGGGVALLLLALALHKWGGHA